MVTENSACKIALEDNYHERLPLNTDHSNLVKFNDPEDEGYQLVKGRIRKFVRTAPEVVQIRFHNEARM